MLTRVRIVLSPDGHINVDGKVWKNISKKVSFNFSDIRQITFYESSYLQDELKKELNTYFQFYKILKRGV